MAHKKRYIIIPKESIRDAVTTKPPTHLLPSQRAIQAKKNVYTNLDDLLLPPLSDIVIEYLSIHKCNRSKLCGHTLCVSPFLCCLCADINTTNKLCIICKSEKENR